MRPLMVLGCTSDAGKSLLATALCRWFARDGIRVAPFKAQNMSNNARVVAGGEIGVAQWLQARAAGVEPTVSMNPVLVKPEAETRSQVVVNGVARHDLSRTPWADRHDLVWDAMVEAFAETQRGADLVVLEGAGSPAEINLRDQVNNRMMAEVDAVGVLVSDIDRGGSFAHLYGTWALVPDATRDRLAGFVLNRFRGDPNLLAPGPARLTELTGMAHVGTVPMVAHDLPAEEGATVRSRPLPPSAPSVAVLRLPFGSNLDEFRLLPHVARVEFTDDPAAVDRADWVILPGSKHVTSDLDWLRSRGLDAAIMRAAAFGRQVVGICGGAMMMGRAVVDPDGVEGGSAVGLGLLPYDTEMGRDKIVRSTDLTLDGVDVTGYEIRHGNLPDRLIRDRAVMATTVHGLFESVELLERWFGTAVVDPLEHTFEALADLVDQHLDAVALRRWVGA